jgi:phage repressor protein C with HTH and peptisase S24 domain
MNWDGHKEELKKGNSVSFRPKGNSMQPLICSGDEIKVVPIKDYSKIKKGSVVFCKVNGNHYVHLVQAVTQKMGGYRFQIGNNKNHTNGTISQNQVFGVVKKITSK